MPTYRFTAYDPNEHSVAGHVDAPNVDAAKRQLEERGLRVCEVMEAEAGPLPAPAGEPLAREEAGQLVENLAQLSAAGLPLPPGLRAAAEESDSPRLRATLVCLADQLERGRTLEEVVASSEVALPRYTSRLIVTAAQGGHLGPALMELIEHYRAVDALRRGIWRGLAYPLVVAGLATLVIAFITVFVAGGFERIFMDFGAKLPAITIVFFSLRGIAPVLLPVVAALVVIAVILLRWLLTPATRRRWLATAPVIGLMWHWLGLLEWIGMVRAMVRNQVPLHEALRLSADGASDAHIAQVAQTLADGVARGRSLSQAMAAHRAIPASLVPLVRWGEESGALVESLDVGGEMLEERVRLRSLWLRITLPPVLFLVIAGTVLWVIAALMMPLISLIQTLTGGVS